MSNWVNVTRISDLKTGDIVRAKMSGDGYVVTANYGDRATAVRTADITNPPEWEVSRPTLPEATPASDGTRRGASQ